MSNPYIVAQIIYLHEFIMQMKKLHHKTSEDWINNDYPYFIDID